MPNPIDVHVGVRIRIRRTMMGFSQMSLAEHMGLTFQQVQKYERGTNRVSSSRLFDLARILEVPLSFFFDEMGADVAKQSPGILAGKAPKVAVPELDPAAKRETLELVRAYYEIGDEHVRRRIYELARSLAAMEEAAAAAKGRAVEKADEAAETVVPPPVAQSRAEQRATI